MIILYKSTDKTIELNLKNPDGTPVNLTSCSLQFSVKEKDTDTAYLIHKESSDISKIKILTPETDGKAEIYIVPLDTGNLNPGNYLFDIQLTDSLSKIHTLILDTLIIHNKIT